MLTFYLLCPFTVHNPPVHNSSLCPHLEHLVLVDSEQVVVPEDGVEPHPLGQAPGVLTKRRVRRVGSEPTQRFNPRKLLSRVPSPLALRGRAVLCASCDSRVESLDWVWRLDGKV